MNLRLCLTMMAFAMTSQCYASDMPTETLFWGNGDSLTGRLVSAQGDTLIWEAPSLFAEPLELDLSVLSSVRFSTKEATTEEDSDEFRITMANNNVLYGRLVAVGEKTIAFESARHGQYRLQKHKILSLQRTQKQGLVYLGPRGVDEWKPRGSDAKLSDWHEENDGSLTTLKGSTGIYRQMKFPKRCEVEVILTSTGMPDFILSLGGQEKNNPRVEMWGDEMICRCGLDFVELQTVKPGERKLHFRVLADFEKQVMAVYTNSGRLLGRTDPNTETKWATPTLGLIVEAVEGDLTIKHVRVSEWDGQLPKNLLPGETRVHSRNGDIHYGTIAGYHRETGQLQIQLNDVGRKSAGNENQTDKDGTDNGGAVPGTVDLNLDDVATIVLSTEEQQVDDSGKTLVSWKNGGFVSGAMVSMDHDFVVINTGYSPYPIRSALQGSRRIRLPNTAKAPDEPDRLFFDGGSLRGNLTVEDAESNPIRWKPVGGLNSTTLISRGKARFQRGQEPQELSIDTDKFPDVVFLRDGDVIPCSVTLCDEQHIRLSTPVADVRQLRCADVKAIELGSITRLRQVGFDSDDWRRVNGTATIKYGKLGFRAAAIIGSPNILTGNAISFRLKWTAQTYGSLTTWLYAEKVSSPQYGTPVTFTFSPSQVTITDEVPDNNRGMVFFGGMQAAETKGAVRTSDRDVQIRMVARDGKLRITANGKEVGVYDMNARGAGARGMVFGSAITLASNRGFRANTAKANDKNAASPLEISEFTVRNVSGTSAAQFINEESRKRTLTVPRFREDDPPTHVLLAPNGDLLRGRLNAVTDTHVVFESRLEEFRFPRERVTAVIWLRSAEDTEQSVARRESAVQAQLDNGYTVTMTPERMSGGQLIGSSDLLGTCSIPARSIRDLFLGNPDGREEIMSYVSWIPTKAPEPTWETSGDDGDAAPSPLIGKVADDFELETLNGEMFRLSDHRDKIVVLDFWASWCGPCVAALPQYIAATDEFEQTEAIFVAVNLEETRERIHEFLERQNLEPTVALDRGSVIARRFGVSGIPHSVVLGKGNVIKHVTVGLQENLKQKTHDRIHALLEE